MSSKITAVSLTSPIDHFKITIPPKIPIAESKYVIFINLPKTSANIANTEVKTSANMCKYADLKF